MFFFFKKKCRRHLVFFPANESISSWSSSSVACSCSLFNQIFLVSVFGSCHRSERRRKTRIVKEQIYLAIHLWLFLALKNLCIVPANAPDPRKYRINQNKRTTGVRQQLPSVIRLSYLFFCLDFDWFLFILSPKLVLFFYRRISLPSVLFLLWWVQTRRYKKRPKGTFFSFTWRKKTRVNVKHSASRWEVEPIVFVIATQFI